jgi:6-pyruvoyl-tetrahydropterin synthase
MKLELVVKLRFKATHTLEENETPHEHEWRVEATLTGNSKQGRVISLPLAQNIFNLTVNKLRGAHLNSCHSLDAATREIPTCENLAYFFLEEFNKSLKKEVPSDPTLKITLIEVGVSEDDGYEMGAARLIP